MNFRYRNKTRQRKHAIGKKSLLYYRFFTIYFLVYKLNIRNSRMCLEKLLFDENKNNQLSFIDVELFEERVL